MDNFGGGQRSCQLSLTAGISLFLQLFAKRILFSYLVKTSKGSAAIVSVKANINKNMSPKGINIYGINQRNRVIPCMCALEIML